MTENTIYVDLGLCKKPELTKKGFPKKDGVYWIRLTEESNGMLVSDWKICEIAIRWVKTVGIEDKKRKRCLTDIGFNYHRRLDMPVFRKGLRMDFRTIPVPTD